MKWSTMRPPTPAVNSKRLSAGDVLQAATVKTATEKKRSMSLVVGGLNTVDPIGEDVLVRVWKVDEEVIHKSV
jgi:hypothetical protein